MRIDVVTILPKIFEPFLNESILKRARQKGAISIFMHDLRNFSNDRHKKIDDRPFGGGPGMIFTPQPLFDAVEYIKKIAKQKKTKIILLSAHGNCLNQKIAEKMARLKHLILICGHYEGIDERFIENMVDEQISIGDYVLTGGELPAMILIDTVSRLIPGVLGHKDSVKFESFSLNLLEYPQYTRPAVFRNMKVPQILLSGKHEEIKQWRYKKAIEVTKRLRPDLLKSFYNFIKRGIKNEYGD